MVFLLLAALMTDALIGEFDRLWRLMGHPVTWMAKLLLWGETRLNKPQNSDSKRRVYGTLWFLFCLIFFTGLAALLTVLLTALVQEIGSNPLAVLAKDIILILIASIFLATRSLFDHVMAVQKALLSGDLILARQKVAMIVGRETNNLDAADISRASTETLAENFSDGVIAPAFWFLMAGLPGIVAYKMTNTADSMIGHRTARFNDFGWAAARFDDFMNFIPARLTALLFVLSCLIFRTGQAKRGIAITWRDSPSHASPNAGWPEAAMAGLLGIKLGGPRHYADGKHKDNAWLGDGPKGDVTDLTSALTLTRYAFFTGCCLLLLGGLLWI